MLKTKYVKAGGHWRTLETMWNRAATSYFLSPASGRIRLRVGYGWFAYSRQTQSLNGIDCRRLTISSPESYAYARFEIRVPSDMDVTYDHYAGNVVDVIPELPCG